MRTVRSARTLTHSLPPMTASPKLAGFSQSVLVIATFLVFGCAGLYLYSINKSSVEGYTMRLLEQEIETLRKENGELRVREAEIRSLSLVEEGSKILRMEKIQSVDILTLTNAVALR